MADERYIEVYKQHCDVQSKYVYFLLAAAGAAIALAVNQTQTATITWSKIPLAVAMLCWGISFYCGCKRIVCIEVCLSANIDLHKVQAGEHPGVGDNPELIATAKGSIRKVMEDEANLAARFANSQLNFIVIGAIFFIVWHIVEMWMRG